MLVRCWGRFVVEEGGLEALIFRFRFSPFPFLNLINSGFSVFVLHFVFY